IIVGVFLIIAVLIALLIALNISRPLKNLTKEMRKVETGDLTVRVTAKSKDEVGMLTRSFNMMIENLSGLIQRVQDSTGSLLNSGRMMLDESSNVQRASKEIGTAVNEIAAGA